MKRTSLYASEAAFTAFENAVDTVLHALGGEVPRHVAVSALLNAGARQAGEVTQALVKQRAAELTERLAQLNRHTEQP